MGRPANLTKSIYKKIKDHIEAGEYPEGFKLPTESALCAKFEVSRPVIRNVIERLRAEGVVKTVRGSGSFVVRGRRSVPVPFVEKASFSVSNIGDIIQCQETRMIFEGEMASYAAERWRDDDLKNIQEAMDAIVVGGVSGEESVEADIAFHRSIMKAAHNEHALAIYESMVPQILIGMKMSSGLYPVLPAFAQKHGLEEHKAILDAIEQRDTRKARREMRNHICFTNDSIRSPE
ncbi:FadR/GntR family transcriptional regulator [Polycladidibacter stylochi]|uniref:FadR/GntR family transcriptional regulator n=1 Tax=Polycladidibacter stylochi TaxID=1807766 RepID=UPI00082EC8E0|nr:FadR/GntR family transcriptional regulator [Pseudovibrio stylochi]